MKLEPTPMEPPGKLETEFRPIRREAGRLV